MELPDSCFWLNHDWDPSYLSDIFNQDFYCFHKLWNSNISDCELVKEVQNMEKYVPIVEDISIDNNTLCSAVEQIEEE